MSATQWEELQHIRIDDEDPDFDRLSDSDKQDVAHALRVYAKTGQGGDVSYSAPGSLESDVIRVGRLEVDVEIYRHHPDGPTLVVAGFSPAPHESTEIDN